MAAAGKRFGMVQAKMQGKLKNMLKSKCYEKFQKYILMKKNIIQSLTTKESFMEKVDENVKQCRDNAEHAVAWLHTTTHVPYRPKCTRADPNDTNRAD